MDFKTNPWLAWLGVIVGLGFFAGLIVYNTASPSGPLDVGDPVGMLAGVYLMAGAVTGLALFLVGGAICWQVRDSGHRVVSAVDEVGAAVDEELDFDDPTATDLPEERA